MRTATTPLLERRRVFHSRDPEETRAFLHRVGFHFEAAAGRPFDKGSGEGFAHDARLNGVYFPGMYIGYAQYGTAARIRTTPMRTDYWLQLPLSGGVEIAAGREAIACDTRTAALASPTREYVIAAAEGSARCQVSLTGPALLRQLAALLGEAPRAPLEMAPSIDLGRGYGRSLAAYLRLALAEFEEAGAARWNPAAMTEFEQAVMTLLLLEHPHSYSEALRRLARPIAPRAVKRAVDYMHANLAAPLTIADLVAAAGVAGRTLFQHFRAFKGVSPMRYLRDARLQEVRAALLRGGWGATVTGIAECRGFAHLGRFAVEYRRRYGESPRATLAAARSGSRKTASIAVGDHVGLDRWRRPGWAPLGEAKLRLTASAQAPLVREPGDPSTRAQGKASPERLSRDRPPGSLDPHYDRSG